MAEMKTELAVGRAFLDNCIALHSMGKVPTDRPTDLPTYLPTYLPYLPTNPPILLL
jgi:hypothetical protein